MSVATAIGSSLGVRTYEPQDRQAVRDIACRTAFRNRGHAVLLDDAALFADYWTRYYTDIEPESCLIAERDGETVGYLLGCVDTARFQRVMARSIVPSLLLALAGGAISGRYAGDLRPRRFFRWFVTRSWREMPTIDVRRFPAHYHANILPAAYGAGAYSALALHFLDDAERRGVRGVHGQVLDSRDRGVWRRMVDAFCRTRPDVVMFASERESTMGSALLGESTSMVNRAFGGSLADFRDFILWIHRWRHL